MGSITELRAEIDDIYTLKLISSAFTEASAARVQKIKGEFEKNKQFYEEINHLYHLVRVSSEKQMDKKQKKESGKRGLMSVAVTSNQRFYGNVNTNIMMTFLDEIKKQGGKTMVIGTTGRDYMNSVEGAKKYEYFPFARELPSKEEVKNFLVKTKDYEPVLVYYPKFVSLVTQKVGKIDITQKTEVGAKISEQEINILFEPELTNILEFFETQVRSLLLLRVMLETDLARTAARLITMSGAEERSTEMLKKKKTEFRKIQISIANAKLLETFSAMKAIGVK